MRRSDRIAFLCLGVGVVAILAGIPLLAVILPESEPPPTPVAKLCPGSPTGKVRYVPDGAKQAAYQGAGPHPVRVAGTLYDTSIPDAWLPPRGEESKVQLVACVFTRKTSKRDVSCRYHGMAAPVEQMRTIHTFKIYRARGATLVGTAERRGSPGCPHSIPASKGEPIPPTMEQPLRPDDIVAVLRPYVERTVTPSG